MCPDGPRDGADGPSDLLDSLRETIADHGVPPGERALWIRRLRALEATDGGRPPSFESLTAADLQRFRELAERRRRLGPDPTPGDPVTDGGTEGPERPAGSGGREPESPLDRSEPVDGRGPNRNPLPDRASDRSTGEGSPFLSAVRANCTFDSLRLAGRGDAHRYGRVVPAEVGDGRRELAVALRIFEDPDADEVRTGSDRFEAALTDQLARWGTAGDLDGVLAPVDAGESPRPWAATPRVRERLGDRDRSLETAVREACHLSDAVAALHDRCVIHAGIDPTNVVYPEGQAAPHLDNVGIVDVYRRYADPASYLDARYAAPEYFEDEPGIVDRATDVYQLGAVCFRLFTGRHPVEGSAAEIGERVTDDDPLGRPSQFEAAVPDALDEVVLRATRPEKYERYDSAVDLHVALREASQELLD